MQSQHSGQKIGSGVSVSICEDTAVHMSRLTMLVMPSIDIFRPSIVMRCACSQKRELVSVPGFHRREESRISNTHGFSCAPKQAKWGFDDLTCVCLHNGRSATLLTCAIFLQHER